MFFAWVTIGLYLLQEHQIVIPILLLSYSKSDYSFIGQFFFLLLFWNTGSLHVRLQLCKVGQVLIIWSFIFFRKNGHHGWPAAKEFKITLVKTSQNNPKKKCLDEKINDSRFPFWSFSFNFRFSSRSFQSPQKLAKNITHFTT